jgi:YhcG PDDEXK nuclease domain
VRDKAFDAPTIGIILCKSKNATMVEYALRGVETPMGVSTFRTALPPSVLDVLPSIETLSEKLQTLTLDEIIDDGADSESTK